MRHQSPRRRQISIPFLLFGWFYHAFLVLYPPATSSFLCPHPSQLDKKYFTWNTYTASFIVLIFTAAPIRLLAYAQLGQNFTFTLAKPKGLVKTGLYKYVRHPSYPPLVACHLGTGALLMRWGATFGCWLPSWLAQFRRLDVGLLGFLVVATTLALSIRVREEEEMLRSEFGEEYEKYAKKTKRFIPFVI